MNIKILATCRNDELIPATTMVFKTLRVGFPAADVHVYLNSLSGEAQKQVLAYKESVRFTASYVSTIHHEWIEKLVMEEVEPFIILDTDIIFWDRCDDWKFNAPLAGRYIRRFRDPFTKCVTLPRLHGSFLWVDPVRVRKTIEDYRAQFPVTVFNPPANLFYPLYFPMCGDNYFVDTCGLLYHAVGGESFRENHLNCYDHLQCGTISDIVGPHLKDVKMRETHFAIFENLNMARKSWQKQDLWYERHRV